MPCYHKFYDYLRLERIDFVPQTLIVGTFSPAWPDANTAQWFYGRVPEQAGALNIGNHLWGVLPRIYGEASMKVQGAHPAWKAFCRRHGIAITDLISKIEDADIDNPEHHEHLMSYSDEAIAMNFEHFESTSVTDLLLDHPSITSVYLTRGLRHPFWKNLWQPIQRYCDQHDVRHRTLLTPSEYSRFQVGIYNRRHPEAPMTREDFILARWQEQWHDQ